MILLGRDEKILSFVDAAAWRQWLAAHYQDDGFWMRIYKKHSGVPSVDYAQALDEALCYGWIDGQRKKYDDQSFLQRWTPRRKNSLWSKNNQRHIARLLMTKKMTPIGMAVVATAKKDGRWQRSYDKPSDMTIPADFMKKLSTLPRAKKKFAGLKKAELFLIGYQLQIAKTEATRQKRMTTILQRLGK